MVGSAGTSITVAAFGMMAFGAECRAQDTYFIADDPASENETGSGASRLSDDGLDTIIITAQRRAENLQHSPVSVMALSAGELDQRSATDLRSLQYFIPNLTFAPSQNVGDAAGNIFIRGIGQEDFLPGSESGVGFYVDNVYVARTMGTFLQLIDIDRVEVMRGPQGTLYGRNTIGGAINILSAQPGPRMAGHVNMLAGSDKRGEMTAVANVPLTPSLFARAAGRATTRDGYLRRLQPDESASPDLELDHRTEGSDDTISGRLQLRWLVNSKWTIDMAADASWRRGTQAATHVDAIDSTKRNLPAINQLIDMAILPGPRIDGDFVSKDLLESHAGGGNSIHQDMSGVSLLSAWKSAAHELKLIASYRSLDSDVAVDADGTYFDILTSKFSEDYEQWSLEALFSGNSGRLAYTAGLFGISENGRLLPATGAGVDVLYSCGCYYPDPNLLVILSAARDFKSDSLAAFGQVGLTFSNRWELTAGGRLTRDHKSIKAALIRLDPVSLSPTAEILAASANSDSWTSFTWRAALTYQANRDLMFFGSASTGFKSGGFNIRPSPTLPDLGLAGFAPETVTNFELGARSEWFDRRLRFNFTAFVATYRDIQLRQQTFTGGVSTNTLIENAAKARISGIEGELAAAPVNWMSFSLAYGRTDARYLDVGAVPNLTLDSKFQRTPRDTISASIDIWRPVGRGLVEFHGDFSLRSAEQFQIVASPWDQDAYGLIRARITYRPDERWAFSLFGTNLTDRRYRTAGRGDALSQFGFAQSIIGPPRQVGLEIRRSI